MLEVLNNTVIAWIDVETSGFSVEKDELLEVGAIVSDLKGNQIGDSFHCLLAVEKLSDVIARSDDVVKLMHEKSGLWLDLWLGETFSTSFADGKMLKWLGETVSSDACVLFGGNSISLDRSFLAANLPLTYGRLSHRSIDVTSIAITCKSLLSIEGYSKKSEHRALLDVKDALNEYRFYSNLIKM